MKPDHQEYQLTHINALFNRLYSLLPKENDRSLADLLMIYPATLSNMRKKRVKIGSSLLLKISLLTGFAVRDLKAYLKGQKDSLLTLPLIQPDMPAAHEQKYPPVQVSQLFDHIRSVKKFKSDRQLAEFLGLNSPVISKMRYGTLNVGPSLIEKIHEKMDIPLVEIIGMLTNQQKVPIRKKFVLYRSEKPENTLPHYLDELESRIHKLRRGGAIASEIEGMLHAVLNVSHFEQEQPQQSEARVAPRTRNRPANA